MKHWKYLFRIGTVDFEWLLSTVYLNYEHNRIPINLNHIQIIKSTFRTLSQHSHTKAKNTPSQNSVTYFAQRLGSRDENIGRWWKSSSISPHTQWIFFKQRARRYFDNRDCLHIERNREGPTSVLWGCRAGEVFSAPFCHIRRQWQKKTEEWWKK